MGSIRQRPDGRWEARYTAPDGRQRSVYARTEREVTARLRAALHEIDSGAWREPSKMTVGEWLDIWLSDYQSHTSERTVNKYRCIVNKHFKPHIGRVKITALLPLHIRRMITAMSKTLAASSIDNYMRILRAALKGAIEAGLRTDNPAARVKPPRPDTKKFVVIDRLEIPAFLDAAKSTPYEYELIVMLLTGLRSGELRGLKWEDIDFDAATMHVQRQLQPTQKSLQRVTPPKYGEDRLLHLAPEVVDALKAQRRKQAEQRLAAGIDWREDEISAGLVFRQPSGAPHTDKSIYRAVKAAGAAIGKPDIHPHDLRHSYAIAALRSGANVKTVQYNLGHKTAKMTLDVYAAYTEDAGKADAQKLSDYLKSTQKQAD